MKNKIKRINKRGAEKILSVYWFAILIIIAGAVVAMVSLFYGTPYDVRDVEANIMSNKIANCLSENGKLNSELFKEKTGSFFISSSGSQTNEDQNFNENFNLREKCNLVFETESKSERGEYFLQTEFYDLNNEKVFSVSEGNSNLYTDCKIDGEKYKKISKCIEGEFYSLNPISDDVFKIKILSVIRKTEKNVK